MLDKILGVLVPAATKRASIFTPMLAYNFIFGGLSVVVYFKSGSLWVFWPELILAGYSIYRHEKWANDPKTLPLLAPQKVAMKWLDLTLGDKRNIIEGEAISQQKADPGVQNPESKRIDGGGAK